MTGIDLFTGYVLLMGIAAGVGLLYLLYIERYLIEYDPFFVITVSGLFLFIIADQYSSWCTLRSYTGYTDSPRVSCCSGSIVPFRTIFGRISGRNCSSQNPLKSEHLRSGCSP
jgi:hypothetical protein